MKKFSFVLVALVVGLFLLFPSLSFAQKKGKKTTTKKTTQSKTTSTTKTMPKTPSNPVKTTEPKWETFTSQEGRFSVLFPAKPQTLQQDILGAFGKSTVYTYSSEADSGNVVYTVSAQTPYPPPNIEDVSEYQKLQILRQNVVKGTVLEVKDISAPGVPALQWFVDTPLDSLKNWKQFGKAFFDVKTRRLYVITFTTRDAETFKKFSKDGDKFLESFRVF